MNERPAPQQTAGVVPCSRSTDSLATEAPVKTEAEAPGSRVDFIQHLLNMPKDVNGSVELSRPEWRLRDISFDR